MRRARRRGARVGRCEAGGFFASVRVCRAEVGSGSAADVCARVGSSKLLGCLRRGLDVWSRFVPDDQDQRRLLLGSRGEFAANHLGDRVRGEARAYVEAAECRLLAASCTRYCRRGFGLAAIDNRVLVECSMCLEQSRESSS